MTNHSRLPYYITATAALPALLLLYFISRYNYNLFHGIADGASIVIAACAFTIIWNSRRLVDNDYFLSAGISFLFFAILDFLHMLGNKDMGVFPGYGNLGPTFYIASRYVLSISLVMAPFFVNRKLRPGLVLGAYSIATSLILLSVFYWKIFPVCIIEGKGLTPFKVVSDYVICFIFAGALGLLLRNRQAFDPRVLRILVSSIILMIATGLTFTLYTDPFGITNLVGHFFQIASFCLVYLAFVDTSVTKPQEILYRKLKQHEETLTRSLHQLDHANVDLQREIAEHTRAEEALRLSEEKFSSAFANNPAAIAITLLEDGAVLDVNDTWLALTGYGREEVLGRSARYMWPSTEAAALFVKELKEKGYARGWEQQFIKKSGELYTVQLWAEVLTLQDRKVILSTLVDISERKRVESALNETERVKSELLDKLNQAQQMGMIGSWEWDLQKDRVWWSDETYRIFGLPRDYIPSFEANGAFIHPDDLPEYKRAFDHSIETGEPLDFDVRLLTRDGLIKYCNAKGSLTRDEFGQPLSFVGTIMDITDRKLAEEALQKAHDELEIHVLERTAELRAAYETLRRATDDRRRLEDQLRQIQKMEALGTLTGGIAHDFNNILAAILGFAEMSLDDVDRGSMLERNLKNILKSSFRARDLIRQMLTFSRKTEYEVTPLSLTPLVKETSKMLRASIPSTIEIEVSSSATSDTVLANATAMQQIIMNLATNAAYAMKKNGGKLTIDLVDGDPGFLQLSVRDTGTGMEGEVVEKIFEPFFTTKEVGQGTGMGLAVVYGIVKSLRGEITVTSTPKEGSTFKVLLPKADTGPESQASTPGKVAGGTEVILLVDDEELITELGKEMLERLGYTVIAVTDSREALRIFSEDPSRVDLIITDQTMPDLTGMRLASEVLKMRPGLPIILCTGHSDSVNPDTARAAGIRDFLMKPLARQELAEALRKVLDEKSG